MQILPDDRKKQNEKDVEGIIICAFFGCGKRLKLIEKLAGTKCTEHMVSLKSEPIQYYKMLNKIKITIYVFIYLSL
jgi:hypothetical protein